MSEISADTCSCNIADQKNINVTDIKRVLVKSVDFTRGRYGMRCQHIKEIDYVIECNGQDENDFATAPVSITIALLFLVFILVSIFWFYRWNKARKDKVKTMKENYEAKIDELQKQIDGTRKTET